MNLAFACPISLIANIRGLSAVLDVPHRAAHGAAPHQARHAGRRF